MNTFTKTELLKYAKQFILNGKIEVAKSFIQQIINKTKDKSELIMFKEMLNCLNQRNNIYYELVIDRINELIKKELSTCGNLDNSIQYDT